MVIIIMEKVKRLYLAKMIANNKHRLQQIRIKLTYFKNKDQNQRKILIKWLQYIMNLQIVRSRKNKKVLIKDIPQMKLVLVPTYLYI